ncbi:hypothetical protein KEM55_003253 [Ascosphaera atra]|nr:hypothetical protein KEM55_003253 [Ascosphaera atra]
MCSSGERWDLNKAVSKFYRATTHIRATHAFKEAYTRLIKQGGFRDKPLGPNFLQKVPPYVAEPDRNKLPDSEGEGEEESEGRNTGEGEELASQTPTGSPPLMVHKRTLDERSPRALSGGPALPASHQQIIVGPNKKPRDLQEASVGNPLMVASPEKARTRSPWPSSPSAILSEGSQEELPSPAAPGSEAEGVRTVTSVQQSQVQRASPIPSSPSRGSPMLVSSSPTRMDISAPTSDADS